MEATDVTPASSAGTAPFVPRRLSAPELWWLRWTIFASRWPGLRDAVALAARACAACALVLAAARAGAAFADADEDRHGGIRRRRGWKHAEVSAGVYRGAAALVVPFVLLSALAAVRESLVRAAREAARRRAPGRFHVSVVFLADARDAATRAAARARDDADAEAGRRDEVVYDSARAASSGADAERLVRDALATLARATRRSGGEEAARWLAALRDAKALPPTTALVLVRDEAAFSSRGRPRATDGRRDDGRGSGWSGGSVWSVWSRPSGAEADASDSSGGDDDDDASDASSNGGAASSSESDTSSSSSSSSSSAETSHLEERRSLDASLAVALVVHVVPGVPRSAVGPPASARGAGGWRGDAARFRERCPETVSVAVVELPKRGGGAPGAFVGDAYQKSASFSDAAVAEAVASVAETLSRRLGVSAVVFPVAEDAPTPFVASAFAERGAHAVLRRPRDDPGFVLRLGAGESGGWDGVACGAHARARRDHRRRARRFAAMGGVVAEAEASAFAREDHLREWSRAFAWPIVSNVSTRARPSQDEEPADNNDDAAAGNGNDDDAAGKNDDAAGKNDDAAAGKNDDDAAGKNDDASSMVAAASSDGALALAFARADAEAGVAAVRAALAPADASAGWRLLEARVDGERVGALLLETPPPSSSRRGALRRRRKNAASELAAGSRRRTRVRACWLHPDAARARGCDAYRALLRGAVEFAAARGCVRVDLGAGGALEKRRMGATPARATAMVLFDDWTLRAPADGGCEKESLMSEELLRWAADSPGEGETTPPHGAEGETTPHGGDEGDGPSPVPSRRAARRAARLERRRATRLSRVAARAFRAAFQDANEPAKKRIGVPYETSPDKKATEDGGEDDDDDDDDGARAYYYSDDGEDFSSDEEDVPFADAFDEAAFSGG